MYHLFEGAERADTLQPGPVATKPDNHPKPFRYRNKIRLKLPSQTASDPAVKFKVGE